jgi:hypothetical protein
MPQSSNKYLLKIMDITTIAVAVVVAGAIVGIVMWYLKTYPTQGSTSTTIQSTIEDGKKTVTSKVHLPFSEGQKEGLAFSYTCWVKVDDFAYRYGEQKVIFNKGTENLSTMCPALLVDANTNSLIVKMDTFGGTEVIPISNIPAKKWIHVGLAVDQEAMNIYINGTLYLHHTLSQLPKQNNSAVSTGIGGGFDGKISGLQYYSYFMSPSDVKSAMASVPVADPSDIGSPLPPYFDISWWTSRS